MKVVILAGGLGSRLTEETYNKPKPMVEIGGKPILWHIMKIYSYHNIKDFIICCGYKGYIIKEYFQNLHLHMSDVTISAADNKMVFHNNNSENWNITLVDTGESTMTGGRIKRIYDYVKDEDAFCLTYGDGLGDINVTKLISFHKKHGKQATLTATRPPARYGAIKFGKNNFVREFEEKPEGDGSWINGGFFVLNPSVIKLIKSDQSSWEGNPLSKLASNGELVAYKHKNFWMPMDTMRDKISLNQLWDSGKPPWKIWK